MPDEMNHCTYSPQISPGNTRVIPMASEQIPIVARSSIILQWPYEGGEGATILEIRNPNYNNKLVPKISRIQRESRGGELIVYRDPAWTKALVLNWAFDGLTYAQAIACLNFCTVSLGKPIRLLDYESRVMKGIITNPSNPVSQEKPDSKINGCQSRGFTWKFDFQGVYIL